MKSKTSVRIVALLAVVVLLFSGCMVPLNLISANIHGGGRIFGVDPSMHPAHQAKFNIQATVNRICDKEVDEAEAYCCHDYEYDIKGKFTYQDPTFERCGLKVVGCFEDVCKIEKPMCEDDLEIYMKIKGTWYDRFGKSGPCTITLYDTDPRPGNEMRFCNFDPDKFGIKLYNKCERKPFYANEKRSLLSGEVVMTNIVLED